MPNGKFRFSAIYGTGQRLGYTPQEVNAMSVWQFMAAVDGFNEANSTGDTLSDQEKDELWEWIGG